AADVAAGHFRRLSPLSELLSKTRSEKIPPSPRKSEAICGAQFDRPHLAHELDERKRTGRGRREMGRSVAAAKTYFATRFPRRRCRIPERHELVSSQTLNEQQLWSSR